jgi:hypothetical protein
MKVESQVPIFDPSKCAKSRRSTSAIRSKGGTTALANGDRSFTHDHICQLLGVPQHGQRFGRRESPVYDDRPAPWPYAPTLCS